ncbi:polysaccharide biosynthesis protein [Candidatus Pelagibacter communis]|uniref:polysaccharide biosynthesis protein n=1 Tax=Pelagibacter ubique TaxID=198252 RepID=UPI00094DACD0|nr:polysaccharide biosynthesis protein [Candidatus Pelagibacter ubique]
MISVIDNKNNLISLNRKAKILILVFIDLITLNLAIYISWYLRLDLDAITSFKQNQIQIFILFSVLNIFVLYFFSFYDGISRFLNLEILKKIIPSNIFILFFLLIFNFFLPKFIFIPKSVALIYFVTSSFLLCMTRWFFIQIYHLLFLTSFRKKKNKYVIISEEINKDKLVTILNGLDIYFKSIIFIKENGTNFPKKGEIFGKNFESITNFSKLKNYRYTNFVLDKNLLRDYNIQNLIKNINLESNKIFTSQKNLNSNNFNLAPFSYDKYLKRNKISTDYFSLQKILNKKNILITGAGGSIGSELCYIISLFKINKLVGLESSEFNLFNIKNRINKNSKIKFIPVLGNILDKTLLDKLIKEYRIEIVIHAAAYKHVNLVEENIVESLKNNIIGTRNCLEASLRNKIKNFIMVSSDKAENPLSTMGMSKRICENLISLKIKKNKKIKTSISSVRFGNVWNSSGSVVEIFRNQLENGEDLTVTSRKATRYFMLKSEAAELILQSILYPKNNAVYILDIGTPVNIYSLAQQMLKEFKDKSKTISKIKLIGLSNKEKIHEVLYPKNVGLLSTPNKKIKYFINSINFINFEKKLTKLFRVLDQKKINQKNLNNILKGLIN